MQFLYDYLKVNIFSNISYSYESAYYPSLGDAEVVGDSYELYNPLKTYKKPININEYLLKELNKIDKRLKVIEEILKN